MSKHEPTFGTAGFAAERGAFAGPRGDDAGAGGLARWWKSWRAGKKGTERPDALDFGRPGAKKRRSGSMGESRGPQPGAVARVRAWVEQRRRQLVRVLFVAAVALVLGAIDLWITRNDFFALHEVEVRGEFHQLERKSLLDAARSARGNFFLLDLDRIKAEIERVPWVHSASVRRIWPDRLVVTVEERQVVARWGDGQLIDGTGDLFEGGYRGTLPYLAGPQGSEREVLQRFGEIRQALAPIGRQPTSLVRSDRGAWTLQLEGGTTVELGREQVAERLRRFVDHYAEISEGADDQPILADMRYRNGFSVRSSGHGHAADSSNQGRPVHASHASDRHDEHGTAR